METIVALISWTCYGQWLHGSARGSVDPAHNLPGTPWLSPDSSREAAGWERMSGPPVRDGR